MTTKTKRASSIAIVALVAAAVGLALTGAAAADTTTLAGDGTDHITDFNASESDHLEYSLSSDGTDFGTDGTDTVYLNMTVNDEHVSTSNNSIESADTSYTFNVSHDDMNTIPGEPGENTTVTVNAWGEDTDTDTVNTSVTTFDATLTYHDDYAVVYVGDTATDGEIDDIDAETATESTWLGFGSDVSSTNVDADNVALGDNASGTTIHVIVANQSSEDTFSDAEDKRLGSYESGDFMPTHLLTIEGHHQAVFNSDAPDSLVDDYTYATTGDRGGHDAYTVHVDEDYEDESNVDVSATANGEYGWGDAFWTKRDAFGGALGALTAGLFLFGLAGRREA